MNQTKESLLLEFLKEWYQWAIANKDIQYPDAVFAFPGNTGLCSAFSAWLKRTKHVSNEELDDLCMYLDKVFKDTGVFRVGGDHFEWYSKSLRSEPAHTWKPRLNWVVKTINKLEKNQ